MEQVKEILRGEHPAKWLFYGDSITHGALHTFGWRDYTELFAERLRFELGRTMDVVINTAISGNSTRTLLESFDWRVTQFRPHATLLMIGMNDCSANNDISVEEFTDNLHQIADQLEGLGSRAVLQTTCPILPGTAPDREGNFDAFMEAIRRVAAERALPLVDHAAHWRENADKHFYWMSNSFHPNEYGHRAFAVLLYKALNIYDPESHSCQFYYQGLG